MLNKVIEVLATHEKCLQELAGIKKLINQSVESCEITKELNSNPSIGRAAELTDEKGFPKTHLWHAFREKEQSSCGYMMVSLDADGIDEYLNEQECEHCIETLRLINLRPVIRQQLGIARRQIRALGKEAIKNVE